MSRKTISKRVAFFAMVFLMLVSLVLAFTLLRKPKPEPFPQMPGLSINSGGGFGQTVSIYQDLGQLELLRQQIREILAKKTLTDADSTELKNKLKLIDSIYKRAKAH